MNSYSQQLLDTFYAEANPIIAAQQKAYMRDQFNCLGIKTPLRRKIQKPFLEKQNLPDKLELESIVKIFWNAGYREPQYFAQELVAKYKSKFEKEDIKLIEFMILNNSWWDTVDFIAVHLLGFYFKKFPNQIEIKVNEWLKSNNIWLQRCAILFQLKYKEEMNKELVSRIIINLNGSKAFFINKAIGWILREISRTNPNWVINFVGKNEISALSKREALRLL